MIFGKRGSYSTTGSDPRTCHEVVDQKHEIVQNVSRWTTDLDWKMQVEQEPGYLPQLLQWLSFRHFWYVWEQSGLWMEQQMSEEMSTIENWTHCV